MIPLAIAEERKTLKVLLISADEKTKRHLENIGVLRGSEIEIISKNYGNLILRVKDGRLAINKELSAKIYVD